jgi:hypothetical protein
MKSERKITVMLPIDLVERAQKASGESLTETIRRGLEIVAAKHAYKTLLALKGKFDLGIDLNELRDDG